jgi:sulfur transfer protein SufE
MYTTAIKTSEYIRFARNTNRLERYRYRRSCGWQQSLNFGTELSTKDLIPCCESSIYVAVLQVESGETTQYVIDDDADGC